MALNGAVVAALFALTALFDGAHAAGSVVATGEFKAVNGDALAARHIAMHWSDGEQSVWYALADGAGTGETDYGAVVAYFRNELYLGGRLTGASNILRWDGQEWHTLGLGVNGAVYALAPYGDFLAVGGAFTSAGGVSAGRVALWDGSQWKSLYSLNNVVSALCEHNGYLLAGGAFTFSFGVGYFGKTDGGPWVSAATPDLYVDAIQVFDGTLYIGGSFSQINGRTTRGIATINDVFYPESVGFPYQGVLCFTFFKGRMVAGGDFADFLLQRTDAGWVTLGNGVNDVVLSMTVVNDALIIAGRFTEADGAPAKYLARWDGSSWSAFGNGAESPVQGLVTVPGDFATPSMRAVYKSPISALGCELDAPVITVGLALASKCSPDACTTDGISYEQTTCPKSLVTSLSHNAYYQVSSVHSDAKCTSQEVTATARIADTCTQHPSDTAGSFLATCNKDSNTYAVLTCSDRACLDCEVTSFGELGACVPLNDGTYGTVYCRTGPLSLGWIIGIAVGGAGVLAAGAFAVVYTVRKRKLSTAAASDDTTKPLVSSNEAGNYGAATSEGNAGDPIN